MIVKGKLVKSNVVADMYGPCEIEAIIEISEQEFASQTKPALYGYSFGEIKKIIDFAKQHNFPASPQPQPADLCECNPKDRILCRAMECGYCHKCNKPIPPKVEYCLCFNKDSDGKGNCINCGIKIDFSIKSNNPQPKPREIEEFKAIDFLGFPGSKEIAQCMLKINQLFQLIRTVNGRG